MEALWGILLLVAVGVFVGAPLRRPVTAAGDSSEAEIADLEARKESKYREIADAELDHAAGKLSDEDFRRQDAGLRREAVEILGELDRLHPPERSDRPGGG